MRARHLPRERFVERAAVVEARQRVDVGALLRLLEAHRVADRRSGPLGERLELGDDVIPEVELAPREHDEVAAVLAAG